MNKIAHMAKRQFRQVKRLAAIATTGLLLGGSVAPIWACVPQMNADYPRVAPSRTYNQTPLVLADDDYNLKARSEVDAERLHEHADRAEDRAHAEAHEAARDAMRAFMLTAPKFAFASMRIAQPDGLTVTSTRHSAIMRWKSETTISWLDSCYAGHLMPI
jgi:hypothetical protein